MRFNGEYTGSLGDGLPALVLVLVLVGVGVAFGFGRGDATAVRLPLLRFSPAGVM